jgi:GDP-D-mannose dehydratase
VGTSFWKRAVSFRDLVRTMVDADLAALRAERSG